MGTLRSRLSAPHSWQRTTHIEPWNSSTRELPASWWKPSTFWVTITTGQIDSSWTRARWAALGSASSMRPRRQSYQRQTSSGSRAKASGVARSSGRYLLHRLSCFPLKVGMPLAAEIPAPDKTVIRVAAVMPSLMCSSCARISGSIILTILNPGYS